MQKESELIQHSHQLHKVIEMEYANFKDNQIKECLDVDATDWRDAKKDGDSSIDESYSLKDKHLEDALR